MNLRIIAPGLAALILPLSLAAQSAPPLPALPDEEGDINRLYQEIIRPPSGTGPFRGSPRPATKPRTPPPRSAPRPKSPPPRKAAPAPATTGAKQAPSNALPAADALFQPPGRRAPTRTRAQPTPRVKRTPAPAAKAKPKSTRVKLRRAVSPKKPTAQKPAARKPVVKEARPAKPALRPAARAAKKPAAQPAKKPDPRPAAKRPATRIKKPAARTEPRAKPAARPTTRPEIIPSPNPVTKQSRPAAPPAKAAARTSPPPATKPIQPVARNQPAKTESPEAKTGSPGFAGVFTRQNRIEFPANANRKSAANLNNRRPDELEAKNLRAGNVFEKKIPGPADPYQPVAALPTDIRPTPRVKPRYRAPDFYRGVYINNALARNPARMRTFLKTARAHGINTIVMDVQPRRPHSHVVRAVREAGMYLVARVVVFELGLKIYPPPMPHVNKVLRAAEWSARSGFMEIQLDYIRFADRSKNMGVPLQERYRTIASILKLFTERLRPYGVRVGADIFGRIPFNRDDIIGQKMEVFSPHLDTLYPMLYPSHFYGDPKYQRDPYRTIYDGTRASMRRAPGSKTIAYIQGFDMKIGLSGLGLVAYIRKQIKAAEDAGSGGFVVWNASNRYGPFFRALRGNRK